MEGQQQQNGSALMPFPSRESVGVGTDMVVARQAQEVQAAMVIAKKFPRDENQSVNRVLQACKRKSLAESSTYSYPRGGQQITGPSIRLAEVLAQAWGNIDFGIVELEQHDGYSEVMAYAWDLETNTRQTKVFTVAHERHTKKGAQALTDPRDIYETVANNGARRLRACILGIIPGDVVDMALEACEKTLTGNGAEPLVDRVRKMVGRFGEIGVTIEMIERRLGHKLAACIESEFSSLHKIYVSIIDGVSGRDQWFEVAAPAETPPVGRSSMKKPKVDKPAEEEKKPRASEESLRIIADRLRDLGLADDQAKIRDLVAQFGAGAKGMHMLDETQAGALIDHLNAVAEPVGDAAE